MSKGVTNCALNRFPFRFVLFQKNKHLFSVKWQTYLSHFNWTFPKCFLWLWLYLASYVVFTTYIIWSVWLNNITNWESSFDKSAAVRMHIIWMCMTHLTCNMSESKNKNGDTPFWHLSLQVTVGNLGSSLWNMKQHNPVNMLISGHAIHTHLLKVMVWQWQHLPLEVNTNMLISSHAIHTFLNL